MEFQWDCQKDKKNYSSLNFLAENLEKSRSNELYGAALEGSTISLCGSSLGCTSMESCQLADLMVCRSVCLSVGLSVCRSPNQQKQVTKRQLFPSGCGRRKTQCQKKKKITLLYKDLIVDDVLSD